MHLRGQLSPVRRVRAILVAATLLAACGAGSADGAADGTEPPTTAADEPTTTAGADDPTTTVGDGEADDPDGGTLTEEVDEHLAEEGHTQLVELSLELLIEPEELAGAAFTDAGYVPDEGANDCGVDTDAEHPADVLVGTALVDPEGRSIVEELRVYADTDASAAAFAAHRDALACGTDGDGTTFGEPTDVSEPVGAGAATEVAVTVEDESGVVITALVADAVLTFRISAPAGTPPTLDPREVAAYGVGKVLAALEAA